jgi:hypothetical protein
MRVERWAESHLAFLCPANDFHSHPVAGENAWTGIESLLI